ncbi:MAG: hypothetical protein E6R04_03575 [Spirochaetes bacterium]|jgi:hypothetical protein|nr:MAG: hypothetical protein E6R04_03575 [Spirochaetota bacterium]
MSLVVHNAYRFPVSKQRDVHRQIMLNVEALIKRLVDDKVEMLVPRLRGQSTSTWFDLLNQRMWVKLPPELSRRIRVVSNREEDFIRAFLREYTRYLVGNPSQDAFVIDVSWTYMFSDDGFTYMMIFPPSGRYLPEIVLGLDDVLEPYSYDGRVDETDHPTEDEDTVKATWERVIGDTSPSYVGATARLEGYELARAFRLVGS